jgi:hypothetical protein
MKVESNTNTQHGMKGFNIIEAKQANIMNRYFNIKRKLLITNANIWFNKQTLSRKVTPKYVKVNVSGIRKYFYLFKLFTDCKVVLKIVTYFKLEPMRHL